MHLEPTVPFFMVLKQFYSNSGQHRVWHTIKIFTNKTVTTFDFKHFNGVTYDILWCSIKNNYFSYKGVDEKL